MILNDKTPENFIVALFMTGWDIITKIIDKYLKLFFSFYNFE